MAGNSKRRGAVRGSGKKSPTVGSGGQRRKGLEPKGPTPKAEDRVGHPAARRKTRSTRSSGEAGKSGGTQRSDIIAGRNAVSEALAAGVPAETLYVLDSIDADDRVRAAIGLANKALVPVVAATRGELDRTAGVPHHQGLVLATAPFGYAEVADIAPGATGLLVALDHITDPHNLGAITRSAAAFAADGVIVPQRRSATVTAGAWKASAGALARMPVARVGNLVNALTDLQRSGYFVIGLDGSSDSDIAGLSDALVSGPLVVVVGAEDSGLARLTAETCDVVVRIPMAGTTESLNASVAAGITLYELARRR